MKISFVIPCYRSEHTIEAVVAEIKSVVSQRPEVDYEVIMVSDHSPDNVYSVIERMCKADPQHLKGLELARNFGQQSATFAGFSRATGSLVFALDDDGQAPVDSIFRLVDKIVVDGHDIAVGVYASKKHGWFRNFGSWVNDLMAVWLIDKPRSLRMTSFRVFRRFVIDEVLKYNGPFPYLGGMIFKITRNIAVVEVEHRSRSAGTSGYTFAKLVGLWLSGFTAFSVKPLRLASFAGAFCAVIGFALGFWVLIRKLFINPDIPVGYSSIMSAVFFIGGMLMIMLGLIGEYIGRIYICINRIPQYVIGRETGKEIL